MTEPKRRPRPCRARALLAIAAGAATSGTVATSVMGCDDDGSRARGLV